MNNEQETIELGIVGIKNMGDYNSETTYEKLNVVTYNGSSYCALKSTVGNLPTDTEYWQLYAQKGDTGAQGVQGIQGVQGEQGIQGEPGGKPLVASSTSEMTDTDSVYVNITDGKWYYYDGDSWEIGGTYQSTAIADNSITSKMLKTDILKGQNMKYLLSSYKINTLKDVKTYNVALYSDGHVGDTDGSRLTSSGYLTFTKNPRFMPISSDVYYFVDVFKTKNKQTGSFDFSNLNLEAGNLNSSGVATSSDYHIRTTDFITVTGNKLFEPDINNYIPRVYRYDNSGNFIDRTLLDVSTQTTYTFQSSYKYKLTFQCNIWGYPIDVSYWINQVKSNLLTELVEQVTSGWHDYVLSHNNTNSYLYKLCIKKKNNALFNVSDVVSDYVWVTDDLLTPLQNKSVSILGDSFSAYAGIIPSGNVVYYNGSNSGVANYNEMWWQRLINNNGASRGIIQASSGSNVSYIRGQNLCLSNSNMCQALGTPDIIIILGGTNDFSHTPALLGTYDGTGSFPTDNNNFSDAYALMLNRILTSYPNATVFCCGIPAFVRTNLDKTQPEQNTETNGEHKTIVDYSNKIKRIAEIFNCQYIDMNECGYNRTDYYPTYCQDSNTDSTHPNAKGQEVIFKCIEKKVLDVLSNLQ